MADFPCSRGVKMGELPALFSRGQIKTQSRFWGGEKPLLYKEKRA